MERRGLFGAPFGYQAANGSSLCLVAIRNVQWSGSAVRIGSGAGILAESIFENELAELESKREQVKNLFRLDGDPE